MGINEQNICAYCGSNPCGCGKNAMESDPGNVKKPDITRHEPIFLNGFIVWPIQSEWPYYAGTPDAGYLNYYVYQGANEVCRFQISLGLMRQMIRQVPPGVMWDEKGFLWDLIRAALGEEIAIQMKDQESGRKWTVYIMRQEEQPPDPMVVDIHMKGFKKAVIVNSDGFDHEVVDQ